MYLETLTRHLLNTLNAILEKSSHTKKYFTGRPVSATTERNGVISNLLTKISVSDPFDISPLFWLCFASAYFRN